MATTEQAKTFIFEIAPIVQKYAKQYGYSVVSPIIAQACIESNYGLSKLSADYHNYFGMKCGSSWKGKSVNMKTKEEYTPGTLSTIRDNFREYDSVEEGIKGYFDFISSKRYTNLKTAKTPQQYLEMIRADGYATSFTYVTTNMNCIKKWDLTQFDSFEIIGAGNPYREPISNIKLNMAGNTVKWIQYQLNLYGYKLVVDGIFGRKTDAAVKDFQENHHLVDDGIVGILTRTALKEKLD
jgi:hypothetical protein